MTPPFPAPMKTISTSSMSSWHYVPLMASHRLTLTGFIPGTWNMGPLWGGGRRQWSPSAIPPPLTMIPVGSVSDLPPIRKGLWRGDFRWETDVRLNVNIFMSSCMWCLRFTYLWCLIKGGPPIRIKSIKKLRIQPDANLNISKWSSGSYVVDISCSEHPTPSLEVLETF